MNPTDSSRPHGAGTVEETPAQDFAWLHPGLFSCSPYGRDFEVCGRRRGVPGGWKHNLRSPWTPLRSVQEDIEQVGFGISPPFPRWDCGARPRGTPAPRWGTRTFTGWIRGGAPGELYFSWMSSPFKRVERITIS